MSWKRGVYDTARYYERVVRDNGGLDKTMSWVRYFEVPGMNHCGGGPALEDFDPLTALVEWTDLIPCICPKGSMISDERKGKKDLRLMGIAGILLMMRVRHVTDRGYLRILPKSISRSPLKPITILR